MKKSLAIMLLCLLATGVSAQTTVHFKPGPSVGEDASIFKLDNNCILTGDQATPADLNYGNEVDIPIDAWTWYGGGCTTGYQRSLLRFSALSGIPPTATITNATLILQTPPSAPNEANSFYSGSPFTDSNPGWVKSVTGVWNEQNVTWNTQPTTDPNSATWVNIPATGSQYNWTSTLNVTQMVQNIVSSGVNNGFLLDLQTETHYRSQSIASSDYPDSTYWPELVVTYINCDATFSYTVNTNAPYTYTFIANNAGQSNYQWSVNGSGIGNGTSINYTFPGPGNYTVCLYVVSQSGGECRECFQLCVDENGKPPARPQAQKRLEQNVLHGHFIPGDDISQLINDPVIVPNPSHTGWNIHLKIPKAGSVSVTIYDITGNKISAFTQKVNAESETIYQDAAHLDPGMYIIEVKGAGINLRKKAIKD